MIATSVRHIGITCRDIEKSIFFYNCLGFYLVKKGELEREETKRILNIDSELTYYKLYLRDNPNSCIELYHFSEPQEVSTIYSHHIAITVENADKMYEKLKNIGISFSSEPFFDKEKKNKLCFCRDFDNHILELVEPVVQQIKE